MIMSFVAGIMLLAAAIIPPFPFPNYDSVIGAMPTGETKCEGKAMVVRTREWYILSAESRDIFLHLDSKGEPDFVYFTSGTSGGPIRVRVSMTMADARARYSDPCVYLLEKDV